MVDSEGCFSALIQKPCRSSHSQQSGFQDCEWRCYPSRGLGLELAQRHLHHMLLAKASPQASSDSRVGEILSLEGRSCKVTLPKGVDTGRRITTALFPPLPTMYHNILCVGMQDVGETPCTGCYKAVFLLCHSHLFVMYPCIRRFLDHPFSLYKARRE